MEEFVCTSLGISATLLLLSWWLIDQKQTVHLGANLRGCYWYLVICSHYFSQKRHRIDIFLA